MNAITVKDIVVKDFRTAAVFERNGIDFCCSGGISLEQACEAKGLDITGIRKELAEISDQPDTNGIRFGEWDLDVLVEHIVTRHHRYVKETIPVVLAHTARVASVHGERYPEVVEIARLFEAVAEEMTAHMQKEELMLFPFIRTLAQSSRTAVPPPAAPFGSIAHPIRMMEAEHSSAGGAMERIRTLSDTFQPPQDACTTYRVSYQELQQFEGDLHLHVHLENNILFPRALELEDHLVKSAQS